MNWTTATKRHPWQECDLGSVRGHGLELVLLETLWKDIEDEGTNQSIRPSSTSKDFGRKNTIIISGFCMLVSLGMVAREGGRDTLLGLVFEIVETVGEDDGVLKRVNGSYMMVG